MPVESLRGSCRTGWHQERSGDGAQLGPEARTACGSFPKSLAVEAAKPRAEAPLGFQLVPPANPDWGLVRAPTRPVQALGVSPP